MLGPRPTKTQRGDTQKRNKLESEYKTVAFCVLSVIIILLQQRLEISQYLNYCYFSNIIVAADRSKVESGSVGDRPFGSFDSRSQHQ